MRTRIPRLTTPFTVVVIVLMGYVGFMLSRAYGAARTGASASTQVSSTASAAPGPQLMLIYIGRSTCGWCSDPLLHTAIGDIRANVAEYADESGLTFASVGVSLDISIAAGIRHLEQVGPFDEVSVGASWANSWITRYGDQITEVGVPAVLVVRRVLTRRKGALDDPVLVDSGSELIISRTGSDAIEAWSRSAKPIF